MSWVIALATLPFWGLLAVDFQLDLYLTHPLLGAILKGLFPVAVLANVVGIAAGMVRLAGRSRRHGGAIVGIVLNLLPLAGVGLVVFWFLFLFKI